MIFYGLFKRFSRKLKPDPLSILCCRFLATGDSDRSQQFPCGNFYGFCDCSCRGWCHLGLPGLGLHGCAYHRNLEVHCRAVCREMELSSLLWSSGWKACGVEGPSQLWIPVFLTTRGHSRLSWPWLMPSTGSG